MSASMSLPATAAVGLRAPHVREVLNTRPAVPWFEVHSENYFADGGPALAALLRIRADYPLSLHGVGLSLGSTDPLDRDHIAKLKRLIARVEPAQVSEFAPSTRCRCMASACRWARPIRSTAITLAS
jgi:uncharacterized protein (UPF0276 family)